jgi:hypothetical protein
MDNTKKPSGRFPLSLPDDLNAEVRAMARDDGDRPINNMIVVLLREALAARKEKQGKQESDRGNWAPAALVAA